MDTCLAAREVSLNILQRRAPVNKHAMVPPRQGVLTAPAAENTVATAVDASAAAADDVARGAVKPTAAEDTYDVALGAVKSTAADDADGSELGPVKPTAADDDDGLCRRACSSHHHHGLRASLGSYLRVPGRCLAA